MKNNSNKNLIVKRGDKRMKLDSATRKVLSGKGKGNYLTYLTRHDRRNNNKDNARYQLDLLFNQSKSDSLVKRGK